MSRLPLLHFEALIEAVLRGEISVDLALKQAAPPAFSDELSLEAVVALGNIARAQAGSGNWRPAAKSCRILLEATGPEPDGRLRFHRHQVAVADWVYVITEAVKDIPNGELFESAVDHGEQAVRNAEGQGDDHWRRIQLSRLGALHFLPYAKKVGAKDGGRILRWWEQRGRDAPGSTGGEMPTPLEALRTACDHFSRALEIPIDKPGFELKCFAQALHLRFLLGDKAADPARIAQIARKALDLLPNDPDWRLELMSLLRTLGQPAELSAELAGILTPAGALVPQTAIDDQLAALKVLTQVDPAGAVNLAELVWASAVIDEARRVEVSALYANSLAQLNSSLQLFPSKLRAAFLSRQRVFNRAVSLLAADFTRNTRSERERFYALIGLASTSTQYDAETEGLQLISEALGLKEDIPSAAIEMAMVLEALIAVGAGVNEWSSKKFATAAIQYAKASELCLLANLLDRARDVLLRGVEAVEQAGFPQDFGLVLAFAWTAPRVEAADVTDNVTRALTFLWNRYLGDVVDQHADVNLGFILLQAAKAAQFSASLSAEGKWFFGRDRFANRLLKERTELLPKAAPTDNSSDDPEFFLVGVDATPQQPGATATERLLNLEREFDVFMQQRIARAMGAPDEYLLGLPELFKLLDDQTVLLAAHSGRTASNEMVQRLFVVTKDRRVVFGQNLHGPAIATQFGVNINGNTVDDLGVLVASVREAIQDEGDLFQGSRDAKGAMLLRTLRSCFLGGLEATLQEWRTGGIGHIAIWAHGSTHFLPWHLLLDDETPLADSFIVTGLPSVTLLRPRPDPASRPRSGLFAFGRTFEDNNESGLPTLPSVSQELKSVGQVRGAKVYVNETATKAALAVAFREARWIHIATHGAQNPRAPSFHKILLSPGQDDDGVLYAYEVLSSDLRGLDLITLSACETALGRVDRSDNLRGLSAAFFQAGVATIVGTLWAVSDEAAALFFGRLYRQLELGESKLASFSIAQRETRLVFPEFRDWGAFQYLGRW